MAWRRDGRLAKPQLLLLASNQLSCLHGLSTVCRCQDVGYRCASPNTALTRYLLLLQGMPHKVYHGRTGVVWNVTKRALGVEVNKLVSLQGSTYHCLLTGALEKKMLLWLRSLIRHRSLAWALSYAKEKVSVWVENGLMHFRPSAMPEVTFKQLGVLGSVQAVVSAVAGACCAARAAQSSLLWPLECGSRSAALEICKAVAYTSLKILCAVLFLWPPACGSGTGG